MDRGSREAVKIIEEHLSRCKITVVTEGIRAKWQPKPDDLTRCKELGQNLPNGVSPSHFGVGANLKGGIILHGLRPVDR
jgi:hypothetical protein